MCFFSFVIFSCISFSSALSSQDPNIYQWTKLASVGYASNNRQLIVQASFVSTLQDEGFQMEAVCVTQCRCSPGCRAYNWLPIKKVCELLQRTHNDTSGGVDLGAPKLQIVNGSVYRLLSDYTIPNNSLWQCQLEATPPQIKRGVCASGPGTCVCETGWGGVNCDQALESQLILSQWTQWTVCSRTCLSGIQTRSRNCTLRNGTLSTSASAFLLNCNAPLFDYRQCIGLLPCPQWSSWTPYGICTSNQTCGVGRNIRSRVCTNNGTAGRDRFCLGDSSFSKSCSGTSCDDPLQLTGGTQSFGSGMIRIEDGFICSDASFNMNACGVVCRQLGFVKCFNFKQGDPTTLPEVIAQPSLVNNLKYVLSNVKCNGLESTVQACSHNAWGNISSCVSKKPVNVDCIVNGQWSYWTDWSTCSVTCLSNGRQGQQTRARTCSFPVPRNGGLTCTGSSNDSMPCTNLSQCPIDGSWSLWSEWTTCNLSCGGGSYQRFRSCDNPAPKYGGSLCPGDSTETASCNTQACPIDGYWTAWTMWSSCTVSCSGGTQYRNRTCVHDPNGKDCEGFNSEVTTCNDILCPVDGYWLEWLEWSDCSQSCDGGIQNRSRICVLPQYGGANCTGVDTEIHICNDFNCPVNGTWNDWTDWHSCSVTCGGGQQIRVRNCTDPKYGGQPCEGDYNETRSCNENPCPINGYWNPWSDWTICTSSCGGGVQNRSRECTPPQYGGVDCDGLAIEQNVCNNDVPCPVDCFWYSWTSWTACSKSCDVGSQNRTRKFEPAKYGGIDCNGPSMQSEACIVINCPINGLWQNWSDWYSCSVTCGGGQQTRVRNCIDPMYGGQPCAGNYSETRSCNENACPIWSNWSSWSSCSRTCGAGQRIRSRNCTTLLGVIVASAQCTSNNSSGIIAANQYDPCNTFSCLPALSCTEWRQRGVTMSQFLWLDPDGINNGEGPILLYCDMTAQNRIGVSIANHNLTNKTLVSGFDMSDTKILNLTYNNSSHSQLRSLANNSMVCRQFIQLIGVQLPFTAYYQSAIAAKPYMIKTLSYWTSYNSNLKQNTQTNYYWGSAPQPPVPNTAPEKMVCSCGANGIPCGYRSETFASSIPIYCNCDNIQNTNPSLSLTDDGYLNFKDDLPVMQICLGVKPEATSKSKSFGYITLGQLECWGSSS